MGRRYWTHEEFDFLIKNYGKIPTEDIAKILNRTVTAVMIKTSNLGMGCSLNKGRVYTKICKHCDKEFQTKNKNKKYCSDICKDSQYKIFAIDRYRKLEKDIKKQRAIESKKNEEYKKILNNIRENRNYKNVKIFFLINCLGLEKKQGIEKIKEFTKSRNAEFIYKNLRKEFVEGRWSI